MSSRLDAKQASTWAMASQYAFVNGVALLALSGHPVYARR